MSGADDVPLFLFNRIIGALGYRQMKAVRIICFRPNVG